MMEEKIDIHAEAIKNFESVEDREERKKAISDMRFAHVDGAQWDDDASEKRANRPRFSVNKVAPAIAQVVGDQRQNRTSIKVRPVSNGADEKIAKVFNGLIRNIESLSKATNSYDAAFDEEVTGGFGGWRVLTEFNDDDIFEQDIKISPINSAASSLYFGPSAEYDKRDAPWAFVITDMSISEFKEKWPNAQASDFSQSNLSNSTCRDWFSNESVRVAEYWKKILVTKEIALLSDHRVIDLTEDGSVLDELKAEGITVLKKRKVKSHKVVVYKMNGNEILEDAKPWAGKYIPLIPCFGKIHHIEGKTYVKGMVRDAKDPQKIYNYETSQSVETSSLTPKDPYWLTKEMAAGLEPQFKSFNKKNQPFMFFNPDPKQPGPPARTGAPSLQQASLAMISQAGSDIEATTGIYAPALGNAPQLLSEKSVQSQSEKGDRGSFIYSDNMQKSIQYTGEILVDLIPRIYDTQRQIRILNIDGTSELVEINVNQKVTDEQTGEDVIVNDLTIGKYDVVTDSGPSFLTKRTESAAQLIDLAANSPVIQELALDLITQNMDINNNEELTKRIRKQMIGKGIVEPTEGEIEELGLNQDKQPDPNQIAMLENIQMSTQKLMADIENTEADTHNKKVITHQNNVKSLDILIKGIAEKVKLGMPITNDEVQLVMNQRDIIADGQDALERESLINSPQLLNTGQ